LPKNSPPLEGCLKDGVVRNSKNYFNLPFNPALKERAKELRKAGNISEVLLWNKIKNKQFKGYDFDRQKIVGNYIVDFYCTNNQVVIEIDGSSHNDKVEYDAKRDAYLESLGLKIIHIKDIDVKKDLIGVMEMLLNHPALKGTPPLEGNSVDEPVDHYDELPLDLDEYLLDAHGHLIVKHDLFNHDGLTRDGIAEAFSEFAKKEKLSFF
ncbi:MAG: DUF559 domain-containing protein, partial [Bacteroidetes bacterium]|nr:DUF559 domain-containing protein [Bacteroidota bacterium]